MIRSLQIKNIQSHEDTELRFTDGINVIIGSSNQGKSAILRALYWVRTNRPLGIDNLASHWAVNEKGNLTDAMSVVLVNDKGSVERRRTKDENQYIVNGEVLNVVKTDIPVQVSSLLNLSETNVQKQLDSPFLLSETSGEVAKYFNQMVKLDIIDRVLVNAETSRRKLKNTIESTNDRLEADEKRLSEYSWIDDVESLIEEYEELLSKYNEVSYKIGLISNELEEFNRVRCDLIWLESYLKFGNRVSRIEEIKSDISNLNDKIESISDSIDSFDEIETYDFSTQNKWISRINIIKESFDDSKLAKLKRTLDDYEYQVSSRDDADAKVIQYKEMLPDICPLCGKPLEEDKCSSF